MFLARFILCRNIKLLCVIEYNFSLDHTEATASEDRRLYSAIVAESEVGVKFL